MDVTLTWGGNTAAAGVERRPDRQAGVPGGCHTDVNESAPSHTHVTGEGSAPGASTALGTSGPLDTADQ
jgi:hypothetical protein